jgi:hypothetical protein
MPVPYRRRLAVSFLPHLPQASEFGSFLAERNTILQLMAGLVVVQPPQIDR